MTKYYEQNEGYFPVSESTYGALLDKLPPGNYVIKASKQGMFFSKYEKDFAVGGKIYGNASHRVQRIINTFLERDNSTGVLLSGEKGSGKTMLGKLICQELAASHGIPTIFVTEPWSGDGFLELIGSINQPAVIFFDEFEKIYDGKQDENHGHHDQVSILTLLDGIFTTQKLFILTCNDKYKIDEHMLNRPGRIYYAFDFTGLEGDFIREYCLDNLNKTEYVDDVVKVSSFFRNFNFDMLKALIEEVNRYDEKPQESLEYLNINPSADHSEYSVHLIPAGLNEAIKTPQPNRVSNPLSSKRRGDGGFQIYTYELGRDYWAERNNQKVKAKAKIDAIASIMVDDDEDDGDGTCITFHFSVKDIKNSTGDGYELVNAQGDRLFLKKEEFKYDWRAF